MDYKQLILCNDETAQTVFDNYIRPYLNPRESFYMIRDNDTHKMVGFAYRCTRMEIWQDLNHYCIAHRNKDNSYIDFKVETRALFADGTSYLIAMEDF